MIEKLKEWVRRWLGVRVESDADSPDRYVTAYEDITGEGITAIIAGKLAMLTFADSSLDVVDRAGAQALTAREQLIADTLAGVWADADWITAQMLGKGGKVLVPLVSAGGIQINTIDQNRLLIRRKRGHEIVAATLLADRERIDGNDYFLLSDYELDDDAHAIRYRVVKEGGDPVPLTTVARWAEISEEIVIRGVDRLLFAFLRCPRDNRVDVKCHGVPITYGAERELMDYVEHANIYRREFKLTRPMLGLDSALWQQGGMPADIGTVRRTVQDSDDPFVPVERTSLDGGDSWKYYAPAIRYEAMEARKASLARDLEKACGLSQGILTERQTLNYANRDEVRAAMYDTFSVVKAVRGQWGEAFEDLAYAIDVLAERFGLTPSGSRGQYEISIDWDNSLIESTSETFEQYLELQSRGAISKAELRQWVKGGTLGEAEQAIADMAGEVPTNTGGDDTGLLAALRGAGED